MTAYFRTEGNRPLCAFDVPTEVQALSSGFSYGWDVDEACPPSLSPTLSTRPTHVPTTPYPTISSQPTHVPTVSHVPSPVPTTLEPTITSLPTNDLLPTALPMATTSIYYGSAGKTGTIPTEFGLLSNMKGPVYLHNNKLTGTVPTELGLWTGITRDMVGQGFRVIVT